MFQAHKALDRRAGSGRTDTVEAMESVHDYPRPPRVEPTGKRIEVVLGGVSVADTTRALRVLETTHPPNYYVPLEDVAEGVLQPSDGPTTFCEWKGVATYFDVVAGGVLAERAAWTYPEPTAGFEELAGTVSFYCAPMDACRVDGELASPESPSYYGGWVTAEIRL